jgi:hypothetical protein
MGFPAAVLGDTPDRFKMKRKITVRNMLQKICDTHVFKRRSLCLTNQAQRHEDELGGGSTYPLFLDLGATCRQMVSFTPRPLYPRYLLDSMTGVPQNQLGRSGKEKTLVPNRTRTLTPGRAARTQSILTALFWLLLYVYIIINNLCGNIRNLATAPIHSPLSM